MPVKNKLQTSKEKNVYGHLITQFNVKRNIFGRGEGGEGNLFQVTHIWFCFIDELWVRHPEEVNLKSQCLRW